MNGLGLSNILKFYACYQNIFLDLTNKTSRRIENARNQSLEVIILVFEYIEVVFRPQPAKFTFEWYKIICDYLCPEKFSLSKNLTVSSQEGLGYTRNIIVLHEF